MAPEAEPTAPGDPDVTVGSRESTLADGAADKRQVGPTNVDETPANRGSGQHCEGHSEPHGRRRVPKRTRPGRDNSPSREPGTCAEGKAATNDPRGRRLHDHSTQSHGDARRQKPQGRVRAPRCRRGRRPRGGSNQRRSGMVRRPVASETERRGRRTPKGREQRNLMRGGRSTCPPRARRAATRPAR